jgi:hypothetical protein
MRRHFTNGPSFGTDTAYGFVRPLVTKTEFSTHYCAMRPTAVSLADDSGYTIRFLPGNIQWLKSQKRDAEKAGFCYCQKAEAYGRGDKAKGFQYGNLARLQGLNARGVAWSSSWRAT